MRLPRWIQRALNSLPKREAVMEENAAKEYALSLVECLNCKGRLAPCLHWIPTLDEDVIGCVNCFAAEQIVKKPRPPQEEP